VKAESRVLVAGVCEGFIVAVVLRGRERVEKFFVAVDAKSLARVLRESRVIEELRAAYPGWAAEVLALKPLDKAALSSYLGACSTCVEGFLRSACRAGVRLLKPPLRGQL